MSLGGIAGSVSRRRAETTLSARASSVGGTPSVRVPGRGASGLRVRKRTSCHAADDSATKVSCGTSSLPLVSGLNHRVTTNTTAAPLVAISIGTVKPSG
jgi:hypothetical protein